MEKESNDKANIQEKVNKTKGFLLEFIKDPIGKLKDIANTDSNEYFKFALIILIICTVCSFISAIRYENYYLGFSRILTSIISIIGKTIVPVLSVAVYSIIVLILNENNRKNLTTIISTITISKLPMVIAYLLNLLTIFNYRFTTIVTAIESLLTTITIVLGFFALKHLFNKECKDFIKTYILIQVIYFGFAWIIQFIGIYI